MGGATVDAVEVVAAVDTMGVLSAEWTAEMGRSLFGREEKVGWWDGLEGRRGNWRG